MPRAKRHKFATYSRKKQVYMICRNSIEDPDYWAWPMLKNSPRCTRYSPVNAKSVAVLCDKCTMLVQDPPKTVVGYQTKGFPRGWHFKKVFVDKEGNVYHKGVEQPELKGTLKPTSVDSPKKKEARHKLSQREKEEGHERVSLEIAETIKFIKNARWKKDVKAGNRKLKQLEKELKKYR